MPVKTVNPQMRQIDGSQDPIFNVRTILNRMLYSSSFCISVVLKNVNILRWFIVNYFHVSPNLSLPPHIL